MRSPTSWPSGSRPGGGRRRIAVDPHPVVRRLEPGDEAILRELVRREKGRAISGERAAELLAREDVWIVAALEGDLLVGFALTYALPRIDAHRPMALVYELGVAASRRRRGVGRSLLERSLALAREAGAVKTFVLTDTDNVAARGLYRAAGGAQAEPAQLLFEWRREE